MQAFCALAESLNPGVTQQFRGCDPSDIAEYETLVGHTLPSDYSAFLLVMGASDGGLQLFEDGKSDVKSLIDFYRRSVVTGECRFPSGTLPVAVNGWALPEVCMLFEGDRDNALYVNSDDQIAFLYSDRLESLLHKTAFLVWSMNRFPTTGMYLSHDSTPRLPIVRDTLARLHLQPEWYSDSVGIAVSTDDGLLFAR